MDRSCSAVCLQKLAEIINRRTQLFDHTLNKSSDESGLNLMRAIVECVQYIQARSCQDRCAATHSVHSINLHSVSPVVSGMVKLVLVAAWAGDATGAGGHAGTLPQGFTDVLLNSVRSDVEV